MLHSVQASTEYTLITYLGHSPHLCFSIFCSGSKEEELDSDDLDDDEDDNEGDDDDEEEKEVGPSPAEMNGTETLDSLKLYMDQMDQELMGTNIGQSFNLTVRPLSILSSIYLPTVYWCPLKPLLSLMYNPESFSLYLLCRITTRQV